MVAKPAATTPLTTLKIEELCAGILPPGVINIIADINDLGSALTGHPDVAKVTFTGSTATGKKVVESAAGSLKRLTLELGGNDAAIASGSFQVQPRQRQVVLKPCDMPLTRPFHSSALEVASSASAAGAFAPLLRRAFASLPPAPAIAEPAPSPNAPRPAPVNAPPATLEA